MLDVDGGIKPLIPLTFYDLYHLYNVKELDYAYVLILDDDSNFIPLYSSSPNDRSPPNDFY